jgi:hypothetical protein
MAPGALLATSSASRDAVPTGTVDFPTTKSPSARTSVRESTAAST